MTDESASFDAATSIVGTRVLVSHYLLEDGRQAYAVQLTGGTSQIEALGLLRLAEGQVLKGNWQTLEEDDRDATDER
ncbi:hypothetical protein [Tsukamurella tyrosinosolvens]|uniref:hypothetical protein n=1 Tax=Tsukamurella tyrosinosolvens TaxID=57704 RepID=UPI002DD428F7|nr:hypothetical protein [Tsukamurella tyrosinosolvens]MEC4616213.1 hypothetical protein [Tsukamurella tyrosinosolvens]